MPKQAGRKIILAFIVNSEQPDIAEDAPAHFKGAELDGLLNSLSAQTSLWVYGVF